MTIKQRYKDFYYAKKHGGIGCRWYHYDLSFFEEVVYMILMILYKISKAAGLVIGIPVVVISAPIWAIPYLVYKSNKCRKGECRNESVYQIY